MHAAPFYSRAYGGYSPAQATFIAEVMASPAGKTVADPMCGQAFLAASWAHGGADVLLGDLNPGPLALAGLRAPDVLSRADQLLRKLQRLINGLPATHRPGALQESTDWLPDPVANELRLVGSQLGIRGHHQLSETFAAEDPYPRFALGICALAARQVATFQLSDNLTWLRPGGTLRYQPLSVCLQDAARAWLAWSRSVRMHTSGTMRLRLARVTDIRADRSAHFVITSPPYANRLDYARLWAPELAVVCSACDIDLHSIRTGQIGANHVTPPEQADIDQLPLQARRALKAIREHPSWGASNYYFPFFAAYGVELHRAASAAVRMLRRRGTLVMFVRDTVRKDALFPTAEIVRQAVRAAGCQELQVHHRIVRTHVGNLRSAEPPGLYGRAQRECWLAFRKR